MALPTTSFEGHNGNQYVCMYNEELGGSVLWYPHGILGTQKYTPILFLMIMDH